MRSCRASSLATGNAVFWRREPKFRRSQTEAFSLTSIAEYVTPQQIADQVLFIASERGRTISGQAISICGDTRALD